MNYSKQNLPNLKKTELETQAGRKISYSVLRITLLVFLTAGILLACALFGILKGLISTAPDISNLSVAPSEAATHIYSSDGSVLQKLTLATSNRMIVTIDQIPLHLQHAVVAIEDERFYDHKGIDILGIIRAGMIGITTGTFSEGASTITQQLLKNSVFTDWMNENSLLDRFKRKFQEQYLALELEKTVSKDQIMEDYLNTINLGAGCYGVQAAALRYFNKNVSELTLSESAVIAGITQNPTRYNPIINPTENAKRRGTILDYMLEQGYISEAEHETALLDDVYSRIQETDSQTESVSIYSYYVDAMIDQIIDDLMTQKGYTEQQAVKLLYTGGLKVFSAQDQSIQQICDEEFANSSNFPYGTLMGLDYALSVQTAAGETIHYGNNNFLEFYRNNYDPDCNMMFADAASAEAAVETFKVETLAPDTRILAERISLAPQPQASAVIIDQSTGYVKAIIGGRGTKEASLTLNRATVSTRQPGSTFKIVTTYAPALDYDNKTLASVYYNAPYAYKNGVPVNNWDSNNTYTGYTTIREAIAHSINIVAVKCITEITPAIGYQYATKLGITTLYNDEALDVTQPLALGGITDGVTNLELTGAYATIANGGQYIAPKFYTHIEGPNGEIILDNRTPAATTALKSSTAFLLTDAMKDVVTEGTGTYINLGSMPVAGKTGTTSDYKDLWFSGYTPYYTCTVWGGYDNNEPLPGGDINHTYHKILWNSIMNRIHAELPVIDFVQPSDVVSARVCKKSGKLAITGVCDKDPRGSQSYTEYFLRGTEPQSSCDTHVSVLVCQESGLLPSSTCMTETKAFIELPENNFDVTEDTQYAPPKETCTGHAPTSIWEELQQMYTPDDGVIQVPDPESPSNPDDDRRGEEDGESIGMLQESSVNVGTP